MTTKRIETGTPEGDVLGFCEHLFPGWLESVDNNRIYFIISSHGTGMKETLRRFSGDGFQRVMICV